MISREKKRPEGIRKPPLNMDCQQFIDASKTEWQRVPLKMRLQTVPRVLGKSKWYICYSGILIDELRGINSRKIISDRLKDQFPDDYVIIRKFPKSTVRIIFRFWFVCCS